MIASAALRPLTTNGTPSIREQQTSSIFNTRCVTHSIKNSCKLRISIDFNKCANLARDPGVGGSNPLSPTNLFKHLVRRL